MKILMAVSADGYVARSERDDMRWLGPDDKSLFRVLTSVGGECYVGRVSAETMPELPGRDLRVLSRQPGGTHLEHLRYRAMNTSWLLGGQDLALQALAFTLVDVPDIPNSWSMVQEVHLCRSSRFAFPTERRYFDRITPLLTAYGLTPSMVTRFGDTRHELWRIEGPLP